MKKKFIINGYYNIGGQSRLVNEILRELDKYVDPGLFEIVIPKNLKNIYHYKNIRVVRFGYGNKILWVQLFFFLYIVKNCGVGINLYNTFPVLKPDVSTIYDMTLENRKKDICKNLRGKVSYLYGKIMRLSAIKKSPLIYTMTEYSKREICDYYNIVGRQIKPVNAGWQHMRRIKKDDEVFLKNSSLHRKEYYLSVSSLLPHKNFSWVKKAANNNKNCTFAIAGSDVGYSGENDSYGNLVYLGYVTDGEMKSLMAECKAFIHPAYSEGFGMTPLEALSQGAPIIVSNTSCLPSVYGNTAHYINPDNPNIDIDKLLQEHVESPEHLLMKYSWKKVANDFYNNLISSCNIAEEDDKDC